MKKRRARQTIEQWTEIVTDYNPAMETMADFCTRRDLALSTFQRWHSRIVADRCLYVFVNRGRDKLKLLIWHINGYWLLYKRLERQRFQWPDWFVDDSLELTEEQLDYLLDGYNLNGMRPHKTLICEHSV